MKQRKVNEIKAVLSDMVVTSDTVNWVDEMDNVIPVQTRECKIALKLEAIGPIMADLGKTYAIVPIERYEAFQSAYYKLKKRYLKLKKKSVNR